MFSEINEYTEKVPLRGVALHMDVIGCRQCGKCSASCPVGFAMDVLPHQMVRLLQLEAVDSVLQSEALWLCIQCGSCTSSCPSAIDLAECIQELRTLVQNKSDLAAADQRSFHRLFLRSIERHGRVYDTALLVRLLHDQDKKNWKLVWPAFARGKMRLWPSRTGSRLEIQGYFNRVWPKLGGKHA